jgi:hypothetical protein
MPEFEDLPFFERPDLTPYLVHLTKNTERDDDHSAYDNLVNILRTGRIWGSDKAGYIKGPNTAACFMDVPFASLKYVLNPRDANPRRPRYEPYGIIVTKRNAQKKGCRPVLYLSDEETKALRIPRGELWRVVKFSVKGEGWISWLHEREWRCKGDFRMPATFHAALVRNSFEARDLNKMIRKTPDKFKATPLSVIPLDVICQGLPLHPVRR